MKYISVDCGKYNTKVNAYDAKSGIKEFKFRTKVSEGTFDDDMLEKDTFIVQINDGPIYKVGNGAKKEPDMETSKTSEVHKMCALTAIALAAGEDSDVSVAIGIPLQIAGLPEDRIAYKDYILGGDDVTHAIRVKTSSEGPVKTIEITVKKRLVYPEGIGVLFEYPSRLDSTAAIIDIGNLNTNNTYADRFNIIAESCFTDELGGKVLISGLAQTLSSELGARVDDNLVASTLLRPYENRFLTPRSGSEEIKEKSRRLIDEYLIDHVKSIKRKCDTRHWPLEFMDVVCVGGTSKLLKKEIEEVFGVNAFIPDQPEYSNVRGFLKKMCADAGIALEKED